MFWLMQSTMIILVDRVNYIAVSALKAVILSDPFKAKACLKNSCPFSFYAFPASSTLQNLVAGRAGSRRLGVRPVAEADTCLMQEDHGRNQT
jgi:hypothetical protein